MNIAIQDMIENRWTVSGPADQAEFWQKHFADLGERDKLDEFNAWVKEEGITPLSEASDRAEEYVNLPSNWEPDTPEKVRLAVKDAFLAGYEAGREA